MDRIQVVTNAEPFDCSICMSDCTVGEGIMLRECLHVFCKDCLMHLVVHSSECIVKCPFVNDKLSGCDGFVQEREIRGILSEDQYQLYIQRMLVLSMNMVPNSFACRTVNCKGFWIVEPNDLTFICILCNFENCLKCKVRSFADWRNLGNLWHFHRQSIRVLRAVSSMKYALVQWNNHKSTSKV